MVWTILKTVSKWLIALGCLPALLVVVEVTRRGPRRHRPAIFWGTEALINIKYHSESIRRQGYDSVTVVRRVYGIYARQDFDRLMDEVVACAAVLGKCPRAVQRLFRDYYVFMWALRNFDIFHFYFRDTILSPTPLWRLELPLLRRAGKKTVFMAYGSDVQVASRFKGLLFKHAQNMDYPNFVREEARILERMARYSLGADYVISGADWVDYMPRWDQLIAGHFAVDTEEWSSRAKRGERLTERNTVKILHAPNHREIKGSRFLIRACEELQAEGLPLELQLVERVPNERIRDYMEHCDIVADQFIIGWYALFAVEAMSMGKPVLAYLRPDLLELYSLYSYASECPIVNAHPLHIKEQLRKLVLEPDLREKVGADGRRYVQQYHSLDSVGHTLDDLYRRIWDS